MFEEFFYEVNKYKQGIHKLNIGASIASIENAEQQLGLNLPAIYKEFLLKCNGGELFAIPVGTTLYKVLEDVEDVKAGVAYLNEVFDKKRRWPNMPPRFMTIASTSYGDLICMDLDTYHDGDAFVVTWDHEEGRVSQSWNGLKEWLMYELGRGKMLVNYDGIEVE